MVLVRRIRKRPTTTRVYDELWRLAGERQAIYFRRLASSPGPWTEDPILRRFKFTNAYRASDRTSQFLIRNVIYAGNQDPAEVFFRTILFRVFNRISTWELLHAQLQDVQSDTFDVGDYGSILDSARARGRAIYSPAYIIPPVNNVRPKHLGHLRLIEAVLKTRLLDRILEASSLESVYSSVRSIPAFGAFLSFQLAIDFNYSGSLEFSEMDFVVAGPGAREGISKCFSQRDGWSDAELVRWATERQDLEFNRLGIDFRNLWGRPLQLIDCQNLFCEVAKYARVSHPEFTSRNGRSRIKQTFHPTANPFLPWYPPKWGINDEVDLSPGG